jgi:DNA polymerase III epsilon subunit-like protein
MTLTSPSRRNQAVETARRVLEQRPVFLDTETTGLDNTAEVVEISVVDTDGSTLFDSLVKPFRPVPASARAVHHISDAMLKSAPIWPSVWAELRSKLVGRLIVIYNEEFDLRMMRQSYEFYRLTWREQLQSACLMKLYAQYVGDWDARRRSYRNISLENAGKACQIALPNSHRALADSQLARAVLFYLAGEPLS